jgi:hypothetical protein
MDDLTGALVMVGLVDLAILLAGTYALAAWRRTSEPSVPALRSAWPGFVVGYLWFFVEWSIVPTNQIPTAVVFAIVLGIATWGAAWLAFRLAAVLVERRSHD